MERYLSQSVIARRDAFVAGRDITVVLGERRTSTSDYKGDYRSRPLFVQYVNPEVLACYDKDIVHRDNMSLLASALHSTRLAVLSTDTYLVMPASYIFEIPNFAIFLEMVSPLVNQGILRYTGPYADLDVYRDSKIVEYRRDPVNPYLQSDLTRKDWSGLTWKPRYSTSTANDIGHRWDTALAPGGSLYTVRQQLHQRWAGRSAMFEKMIVAIPSRLEGQAFISRFVRRVTPIEMNPAETTQLNFFLSRAYLESYVLDLDGALLVDFTYDDLSCGLHVVDPGFEDRLISARHLDLILKCVQIFDYVHGTAKWDELLSLRSEPGFALLAAHAIKSLSMNPVRVAAIRTRRQRELSPATSLVSATDNVQYVVENLIDQDLAED